MTNAEQLADAGPCKHPCCTLPGIPVVILNAFPLACAFPSSAAFARIDCSLPHLSRRDVVIINLDPAAPTTPYPADIDVTTLVSTPEVAAAHGLGPNGSLIYAFEYLAANTDWLVGALRPHRGKYWLFDMPGQVELSTHNDAIRGLIAALTGGGGVRLAAVNLVDAAHCADVGKWVAVLLVSITVMFQVELPIVNVLSKVDLVEAYGDIGTCGVAVLFCVSFVAPASDGGGAVLGQAGVGNWYGARHCRPIQRDRECVTAWLVRVTLVPRWETDRLWAYGGHVPMLLFWFLMEMACRRKH